MILPADPVVTAVLGCELPGTGEGSGFSFTIKHGLGMWVRRE